MAGEFNRPVVLTGGRIREFVGITNPPALQRALQASKITGIPVTWWRDARFMGEFSRAGLRAALVRRIPMTALIEKLEEMKRLERCFMTPTGDIDLMEMAQRVPVEVFRDYCQAAREWRARRPKKS